MYEEKGVDVAFLVKDPMFAGMSLEQKVKAIRTYAGEITKSTSKGFSKSDLKSLLIDMTIGTVGGAGAGALGAMHAFSAFSKAPYEAALRPVGKIALISGLLGAGAAAVNAGNNFINKRNILNRLETIKKDPSDNNILKLLIESGTQTSIPNVNAPAKMHKFLNDKSTDYIGRVANPTAAYNTLINTSTNPKFMNESRMHDVDYDRLSREGEAYIRSPEFQAATKKFNEHGIGIRDAFNNLGKK